MVSATVAITIMAHTVFAASVFGASRRQNMNVKKHLTKKAIGIIVLGSNVSHSLPKMGNTTAARPAETTITRT